MDSRYRFGHRAEVLNPPFIHAMPIQGTDININLYSYLYTQWEITCTKIHRVYQVYIKYISSIHIKYIYIIYIYISSIFYQDTPNTYRSIPPKKIRKHQDPSSSFMPKEWKKVHFKAAPTGNRGSASRRMSGLIQDRSVEEAGRKKSSSLKLTLGRRDGGMGGWWIGMGQFRGRDSMSFLDFHGGFPWWIFMVDFFGVHVNIYYFPGFHGISCWFNVESSCRFNETWWYLMGI